MICHLSIECFRGIKSVSWHPTKRVNAIIGDGDTRVAIGEGL